MAKVVNEPTTDGYEMGYHLSRFYENAGLKPDRCATCAFRQGTYPNGSPQTVMDALKCVMEGIPFNCHEEAHLCAGYVALRAELRSKLKMPWEFSDEGKNDAE